jgi:hypothetical protein
MATSPLIDQVPTTSVLYLLDRMIPLLANGPYSPSTLSQLASLCTGLKTVGPLLDITYKDKMDIMQTLLTKICQDSQLDLVLRLQVLEVIELRTLGWKSNEVVDNYYQERFTQFEESRKEKERREAKAAKSKDGGDKKRKLSQTPSMISVQEQNNKDKQFVTVNGEKIFLSSSNPELAADAKKLLVDHFSSQSTLTVPSATSNMKYSRTDLLTLATSPLAREAPLNWERLVKTLPSVIQRSPVSKMMVRMIKCNRLFNVTY